MTLDLKQKGYQVLQDMDQIAEVKSEKLAGFTAYEHNEDALHRQMDLSLSTQTALGILSENKKGFFLMVEGSQIDWGGHQNNTIFIVNEMLDSDKAIGKALEFASTDGKTLIIITADHETGGFALTGGNMKAGMVQGAFSTGGHTGIMVPVFAYGPGAEEFRGIMENSVIGKKIIEFVKH